MGQGQHQLSRLILQMRNTRLRFFCLLKSFLKSQPISMHIRLSLLADFHAFSCLLCKDSGFLGGFLYIYLCDDWENVGTVATEHGSLNDLPS